MFIATCLYMCPQGLGTSRERETAPPSPSSSACSFNTPIMFSEADLAELQGTPLHRAAAIVRGRLKELWGRLQPALSSLLAQQQGVQRQPSFDDLLWAYSVFWSRGQSLPVPRSGAGGRHAVSKLGNSHVLHIVYGRC